jgi:hypothetical protein
MRRRDSLACAPRVALAGKRASVTEKNAGGTISWSTSASSVARYGAGSFRKRQRCVHWWRRVSRAWRSSCQARTVSGTSSAPVHSGRVSLRAPKVLAQGGQGAGQGSAASRAGRRTCVYWFAVFWPMPNTRPCTTWSAEVLRETRMNQSRSSGVGTEQCLYSVNRRVVRGFPSRRRRRDAL